jgi:6-phosphogluconolactonase
VRQLSRRGFIYGSAALSVTTRPWLAAAKPFALGTSRLLLVGTQTKATSKGIYAYTFEFATGELKSLGLAAEANNPTFLALAPSGNILFAANELDPAEGKHRGAVSSYALDKRSAKLTKINEVSALGDGTCHVSVDYTGRCAFAANYGSGSAVSFSVGDDGHLSPAVSFEQYTGHGPHKRQDASHAHRVTVSPDNRFLLVNDLGLDRIHIYRLDAATAKLTPNDPPAWQSAPGSGPRALRFHPSGKWAYCITELTASVDVLRWDKSRGTLETIQEISLAAPDRHGVPPTGCEIVLDHHARFAYAADRFDDIIVTFAVSPKTGKLKLLNRISCGGKVPRHIALDPSGRWLLAANQGSDNISVLARNPISGQLTQSSRSFPLSTPQCLIFA